MKKIIFALLCLLCASCKDNVQSFHNPEDFLKGYWSTLRSINEDNAIVLFDEDEYRIYKNRKEIDKTLIINDTIQKGSLCAIFYSYSIGSTVYRKVEFAKVIDGFYLDTYLSKDKSKAAEEYGVTRDDIAEVYRAWSNWSPETYFSHY